MAKDNRSKIYLVESIPMGLDDLISGTRVRFTAEVLKELIDQAQRSIDITSMYWSLKPNPKRADEKGFTMDQVMNEFGGKEGAAVYLALEKAADRGVKIRIVESPGFDKTDNESGELATKYPDTVKIRQINMTNWYGAGIMHQKIWVFDRKTLYLGSANNDWKAMTQVKEIGVVLENSPKIAIEMLQYFDTWWHFCKLPVKSRSNVLDPTVGVTRKVPQWSLLIPAKLRRRNPLNKKQLKTTHDWNKPLKLEANGKKASLVISGSPLELCVDKRETDINTILKTINDAKSTVCINVMDLAPIGIYARGKWNKAKKVSMIGDTPATPVWWAQLFDALLYAATTKGLHVRLLVSHWAQSSPYITPFLDALQSTADAASANNSMKPGTLEIRRFVVPGWDSTKESNAGQSATSTSARKFPGHSRVNHTKFIVTDRRANIGTSNMTLDYFQDTAGSSFNTDHPDLVRNLQAVFNRDWNSIYAHQKI